MILFIIAIVAAIVNFTAIKYNHKAIQQYAMTILWSSIVIMLFILAYEAGKVSGSFEEEKKQHSICEERIATNNSNWLERVILLKKEYEEQYP